MALHTCLADRLGIRVPVIQAPMAGGASTVDLVAVVGEAGGLGFFGAAYATPEQIAQDARALRGRSDRPFGINLFAPQPAPVETDPAPMLACLAGWHAELGLPAPAAPVYAGDPFKGQMAAALESGASVFSFTFGIPPAGAIEAAKARGMAVIGTATTVAEALALQEAGVDAVAAQGSEAGAHRGTFATDFAAAMVGTIALVPQMVDALDVPVIASGGIMDGRGLAAALVLGAQAVQMGTAFLACHEAGIAACYKDAILAAREDATAVTRAFSGRPARGIVNRVMAEVAEKTILPFPLQNDLTRPMRGAAARQGRAEFLSLWAGQGVGLARRQGAADLVRRLAREAEETLAGLAAAG